MPRQPTTSKGVAATTKARRRSPTPADDSATEHEDSLAESQASDDQDTIKLAKAMIESVSRQKKPLPMVALNLQKIFAYYGDFE